MGKYNTIIWDMDGTLLDTLDDLADSVNEALAEFRLPIRTRDEIRSFIGNGVARLIELSVPEGKQHPQYEEILTFFKSCYKRNCRNKTKPFDGLDKMLQELGNRGYRMAIVSNKADPAVKELARLYFGDTISVALGDAEGFRRKPYPDTVFKAIRLLEADKASAIYIGDTEVDIATAKNAGIDCICVTWGYRSRSELQAAGAKLIADSPDELAEILMQHQVSPSDLEL